MSLSRVCNCTDAPRGTSSSSSLYASQGSPCFGSACLSVMRTSIFLAGPVPSSLRFNSMSPASTERARTSLRSQPVTLILPDEIQTDTETCASAASFRSILVPRCFSSRLSARASATEHENIKVRRMRMVRNFIYSLATYSLLLLPVGKPRVSHLIQQIHLGLIGRKHEFSRIRIVGITLRGIAGSRDGAIHHRQVPFIL